MNNSVALILDDHELFNDSFSALIEKLNLFGSVHSFTDEKNMISFLLKNENPNTYLFVDYYLKDTVALPVISDAKRIQKKIKVILVSSIINPLLIKNILNYTPNGLISKSSNFEVIVKCIKTVEAKEQFICPVITEILKTETDQNTIAFTAREIEILQYFSQGHSIDKTAELSNLSKHTIVAHRRNMMSKANCNSITELLWYSRQRGII